MHLRLWGSKYHVNTESSGKFKVILNGTRVFLQVNWVVELEWIDKNRYRDHVALPSGQLNQLPMTVMECPHGGNKPYRLASHAQDIASSLKFRGA